MEYLNPFSFGRQGANDDHLNGPTPETPFDAFKSSNASIRISAAYPHFSSLIYTPSLMHACRIPPPDNSVL